MPDLCGEWTLVDDSGLYPVPFSVPGDGITALHRAGAIEDPYWGRNVDGLRWISERDWLARRFFVHDGAAADRVIEGLDCMAEVQLNGTLVLTAANTHRRWRVDVAGALRQGENRIAILFRSAVRAAAAALAGMPFPIPGQAVDGAIPNGNMLRKPQCDFGRDWNIALGRSGLTGRIALEPQAPRIGDVLVAQDHRAGLAEVTVEVTVARHRAGAEVTSSLCGVTQTAAAVGGEARLVLCSPDRVLWWPAGQGAQVLHPLTVTTGDALATRQIGLRDIALISAPDAAGRSFGFRVNGRDVFAKGANWIPADALNGRITPDAVRGLLQSAVDAHMNMIRVSGGGRYEPDWFYDLCDAMGLMVWQDFMFACHIYSSTPAFLAEVDAEVRDVGARISHHARIALWCGDNELIGALTWFPETRADRDRYLVNYDRLSRAVEAALLAVVPGANWWPSSPSPGPLAFGDGWHDDRSGDVHFWSVWHEGRDFDHHRDVRPRFCSEFGFQSYPSMQAIRRFAAPADHNIASPVMESHQKNPGGNARIAETMFRTFRFPGGGENFVYLGQVQQGLAIKTAVTQWRSLKPHCMNTLYWQLNDTWPVCSWSGLDHGGNWKLLHHMARAFHQPVLVTAVPQDGRIGLVAVNDRPGAVVVTVRAMALDMAGRTRLPADGQAEVGGASVPLCAVPLADLGPGDMLVHDWHGSDGTADRDVFAPKPYKSYDLLPPGLTCKLDGCQLTLTAQALALFVAIEADVPGRFAANGFALLPDRPRRVTFTLEVAGARPVSPVPARCSPCATFIPQPAHRSSQRSRP